MCVALVFRNVAFHGILESFGRIALDVIDDVDRVVHQHSAEHVSRLNT